MNPDITPEPPLPDWLAADDATVPVITEPVPGATASEITATVPVPAPVPLPTPISAPAQAEVPVPAPEKAVEQVPEMALEIPPTEELTAYVEPPVPMIIEPQAVKLASDGPAKISETIDADTLRQGKTITF